MNPPTMEELQNLWNGRQTALYDLPDGMAGVLRELATQRRIYFVMKHLKKSQVPERILSQACRVMVPTWFAQLYHDKFKNPIRLRTGASPRLYTVTLIRNNVGIQEFMFGKGWRAFASYHNIVVGDGVIFELTAVAEFKVHIFRGRAMPNTNLFSTHVPRTYHFGSGLSQVNGRNAYLPAASSSLQQFAANPTAGAVDAPRFWIPRQPEGAVFSSPSTWQNSSNTNVPQASQLEIVQSLSPERRSGSQGSQQPQGVNHQELNVPNNPARRADRAPVSDRTPAPEMTQELPLGVPLPGFTTQLVLYNVQDVVGNTCGAFLEVPYSFVIANSKHLQAAHVYLQGIELESPVRPVTACYHNMQEPGEQASKRQLRLGWGDFVRQNDLQVGQMLDFTLVDDSSFVVRATARSVVVL